VLDLGLLDDDRDRRILMHPVDPIVLTKDEQATSYSLKETAFERIAPHAGYFGVLRESAPEIGTRWRSGVDSNSRFRFFSAKTANFLGFSFLRREANSGQWKY
jgi:hypothetical protein